MSVVQISGDILPIRDRLANYRIFQESTTFWCPDREEHGYYITPVFKCNTNPRVTTAHRWTTLDLASGIDQTAGVFSSSCPYRHSPKLLSLSSLQNASITRMVNGITPGSTRRSDSGTLRRKSGSGCRRRYVLLCRIHATRLSTSALQTTQLLVKDTLSQRKNTSPQNVYEAGQLYAAGALKAACIGLQCIGFNEELYRGLLALADGCNKTGRWRVPVAGLGTGAAWPAVTSPRLEFESMKMPGASGDFEAVGTEKTVNMRELLD